MYAVDVSCSEQLAGFVGLVQAKYRHLIYWVAKPCTLWRNVSSYPLDGDMW